MRPGAVTEWQIGKRVRSRKPVSVEPVVSLASKDRLMISGPKYSLSQPFLTNGLITGVPERWRSKRRPEWVRR
jgi:hypothetical protein